MLLIMMILTMMIVVSDCEVVLMLMRGVWVGGVTLRRLYFRVVGGV